MKTIITKNEFLYRHIPAKEKSKGIMLFIHGFATTSEYHLLAAKEFDEYDYYSIELPGNGFAPYNSKNITFDYLVQHTINFIEELDLKDLILIGHSMGGGIAVMLISKIRERIKMLITVCPMNTNFSPKILNFVNFFPKNEKDLIKLKKIIFGKETIFFDDELIQKELDFLKKNKKDFFKVALSLVSIITFANLLKAEKKIDLPTLLMVGKQDDIISYKTAINTYKKYVGNNYVVFQKSGHVPCVEEKDKYVFEIKKFIEHELKTFVIDESKDTNSIVNEFFKKTF